MRLKHWIGLGVLASGLLAGPVLAIPVIEVLPGYDLFQSTDATTFQGQTFQGVPLGTYDFGGGPQNTGNTDTIVQRLGTASVASTPNTATAIPIQLVSLNLESTTPTTLGGLGPLGNYFITTQSQDGAGPASTGTMTIDFLSSAGGTFTSSIDVFFDVHFGAINGPIVAATDLVLSNAGDAWSRISPPGSVLINGVNNLLNGVDHNADFFVSPPLIEAHPTGAQHVVTEALSSVPEPATLGMIALAGVATLGRRRRSAV